MGRTYCSICSGVPCVAIVGAASNKPSPPGAPRAPNSAMAFETSTESPRDRPRPYAFSGNVGADQPARPKRCHQSATVSSGSQFSSSQARTSSTTSLLVEAGRSVVSVIPTASPMRQPGSAPNALTLRATQPSTHVCAQFRMTRPSQICAQTPRPTQHPRLRAVPDDPSQPNLCANGVGGAGKLEAGVRFGAWGEPCATRRRRRAARRRPPGRWARGRSRRRP